MSMLPQDESTTPAIKLFQSAHGKLVTLQRINDQLSSILAQRQRVQDELRMIKQQIDDVFERELRQESPIAARSVSDVNAETIAMRLNALEANPEPVMPSRRNSLEKLAT